MAENKDYSLQDYLDYRQMLEDYVATHSDVVFLNDSRVHAVMVLTMMLNNQKDAEKEQDRILKMFCGKFSLFRDTTKRHLSILESDYRDELKNKNLSWSDFDPYSKLQEALVKFFDNKGRLELIVTSDMSLIKEEESWPDFHQAINNGRMMVWQYDNVFSLDHFTIAGNAYRVENSDEEKTAICCFNDTDTVQELVESFESIKENATPVLVA